MTMRKQIASMIVVAALAACGGGKQAATTPTEEPGGADPDAPQVVGDPEQVTLEQMDEITRLLDRRQRIVSRCLADAVDSKELPKNARGRITIALTINTSGRADVVKVIKNSLESERIAECVIGHVKDIQFSPLPKPYPTSYTYGFEAM